MLANCPAPAKLGTSTSAKGFRIRGTTAISPSIDTSRGWPSSDMTSPAAGGRSEPRRTAVPPLLAGRADSASALRCPLCRLQNAPYRSPLAVTRTRLLSVLCIHFSPIPLPDSHLCVIIPHLHRIFLPRPLYYLSSLSARMLRPARGGPRPLLFCVSHPRMEKRGYCSVLSELFTCITHSGCLCHLIYHIPVVHSLPRFRACGICQHRLRNQVATSSVISRCV